mgnify:CR=1 FL=1
MSKGEKTKGNVNLNIFDGKPVLTVSIDNSYTKKNLYDSIRKSWLNVSESRINELVKKKGFIVGVINKVIMGVVQVESFEMFETLEGESKPRVGFIGKLVKEHPSIHFSIKERTVTGAIQGYNFKDI